MGVTAENLAKKYNISRQDADDFALRSQSNWGNGKEKKSTIHEIMWFTYLMAVQGRAAKLRLTFTAHIFRNF